ncbi:hypothetical protein HZ989_09010 [Brevundimonas sp. AJA228-03]|uniref:hypothetical protein n=1 Tax=Brevundimonas sp. AJA228-03 TaxID=2752515 RepID=UPI001ADFDE97|nr:hypothetical protein [Brevundimonas sp. AJA228-03]QTN18420.1 hypothetical protein HZ989_09010 [Brevundimonas sp. AJA228-03]
MIRVVLIAAALLTATSALAQEPTTPRYQLELSVVQNGVEVVSTRTQIVEDMPASASASAGGVTYDFEANLFADQSDGGATQLQLEANLSRGEQHMASPRLTFLRGEMAAVRVGDESGDLLTMTITPIT